MIKQVDEARMRDVKACIAVGIADLCEPGERVDAVSGTLRVDEIEARLLISRGRRLRREKLIAEAVS
jgi:hypothetical protein